MLKNNDVVKKCASCFVIEDNKILLIYHKKFGKYIQPGGHIEYNEKNYETAIREVFEETGINVRVISTEPFNTEVYDTKIGKQLDYQFIGEVIGGELKNNSESYLCGWFEIDSIDKYDVVPDLKDKIKMLRGWLNGRENNHK